MRRWGTLAAGGLVAVAVLLAGTSVAHAADSSYRTIDSAHHADWMGGLPDTTPISALSIPGTHESLAVHGGEATQTQEDFGDSGATLARQLEAGIRMIDVRARVNDGDTFTIHHGATYQNANFDDVLTTLGGFLSAHPGETVLMRLKQECTGELGSCTDAASQASFPDVFDSYAGRYPGLFWGPSVERGSGAANPTLGDVRGRVVLAVMNGPGGGVVEHYGLAQFAGWHDGSSEYVQDEYTVPNIGAIATKRDQVRRFLDSTDAGDPAWVFVNFASGASLGAFPDAVAGGALGVQGVDPFLLTYLDEGHDLHRLGAIMMDFPGGGLIDEIVSYNH